MRLKKISFKNFRLFEDFELEFPDQSFIVLIGNNGSGKSTILDGIALCLEHLVGLLTTNKINGHDIDNSLSDNDLHLNSQTVSVNTHLNVFEKELSFLISKNKNLAGNAYEISDEAFLKETKKLIENGELRTYPVIGYLKVDRARSLNPYDQNKKRELPLILQEVYDSMRINMSSFYNVDSWYVAITNEENFLKVSGHNTKELDSLKHTRSAFNTFFNELSKTGFQSFSLQIQESKPYDTTSLPTFYLGINKENKTLNFNQLSSGERSIIQMVFAIASKLIKGHRKAENPLEGTGIILIDELDLHFHPSWQVQIVKALKTTFPNIQFIVTTHSPLVLSGVQRKEIITLTSKGIIPNEEIANIFGATANEILEKLLFSDFQNSKYDEDRSKIDKLIRLGRFDEATEEIKKLKLQVPGSPKWLLDYERRIAFEKA